MSLIRSAVVLMFASSPSQAQYDGALMSNFGSAMTQAGLNAMNTQMLLGAMPSRSVSESTSQGVAPKGKGAAATTLVVYKLSAAEETIGRMASAYPVDQRSNVANRFRQMLQGYSKIERQFGIPPHDVAGAVATFLAGSYTAYRNVGLSDENFKALVEQMRQIVGSNPAFLKAGNSEKQQAYEHMIILGMFMATTQMALKEKPNEETAANVRQAAKGYLEQFLKTDADRVSLTAQGLVIR